MPLSILSRPGLLWIVRLLSAVCTITAALLAYWSFTDSYPASLSSCCSTVLQTKWSKFFGMPVTVPAAALYAGVFVLTFSRVQNALGDKADQWLCAAGLCMVFAAVWFTGVLVKIGQFCPVCAALHGTGVVIGGILLAGAFRVRKSGRNGIFSAGLWTSLAGTAVLAAGQIFGPEPKVDLMDSGSLNDSSLANLPKGSSGGAGTTVSFFKGQMTYNTAELPCLGPVTAKTVLVEYFDYTCGSCREMHADLTNLRRRYPDEVAIISLPVPLHRSCNPGLPTVVNDAPHLGACELARWAMTVWKRTPAAFPAYHEFLMHLPKPENQAMALANVETARLEAERVSPGATTAADAWVEKQFAQNLAVYREMVAGNKIKMPKLLFPPDRRIDGALPSPAAALTQLPIMLGLPPRP